MKTKTVQVNIRISEEDKAVLVEQAMLENRSLSNLLLTTAKNLAAQIKSYKSKGVVRGKGM